MENKALVSETTAGIGVWGLLELRRLGPVGLTLLVGFSLFFKKKESL